MNTWGNIGEIAEMVSQSTSDAVILLHGLAANRFVMFRLARQLDAEGYVVANWGYRSIRGSIEAFARDFQQRLQEFASNSRYNRVHLVTHSMGSIIVRRALSIARPTNLGRFVMLGPPNAGSHVARKLAKPLGRLCPPLRELSDAPESYVNRLDEPIGVEVGVIAAELDRVVKLPSTFLDTQNDHIVLPGHHGMLPWRRETSRQVVHFLQYGRFARRAFEELSSENASIPTNRMPPGDS